MTAAVQTAEPAQTTASSREPYIDAVRGLIMLLMVFGHVWDGLFRANAFTSREIFSAVYNWIYFFHMPALFVVSGMLFFRRSSRPNSVAGAAQQFLRLLYPLVLWSYIYFLTKFAANEVVSRPVDLNSVLAAPWPPRDHFWFLWALILIQTFASLMLLIVPVRAGTLVLSYVLFGLGGLGLANWLDWSPWITGALSNANYFFAGGLLSRLKLPERPQSRMIAIAALVFLAIPSAYSVGSFGGFLLVDLLLRYICILALILVAGWLAAQYAAHPALPMIAQVGMVTIAIFMLHVFFTAGVRIAFNSVGVASPALHLVAATLAGILMPLLIYKLSHAWGASGYLGLGK